MATYSLSGSGTHSLTASTTGLQVSITTPSSIGGTGRSNPVAKYDQGLLRFSDGTSYWAPVPIVGGPQFIPVPANATSMGYALLGGAVISVVEVIGGAVFFSSAPASGLVDSFVESRFTDQNSTSAFADILTHSCAAGTWLFIAQLEFYIISQTQVGLRITDGTNVLAAGSNTKRVNTDSGHLYVTTDVLVLSSTTTIHLQGRDTASQAVFVAEVTNFAGGFVTTRLQGLRFA